MMFIFILFVRLLSGILVEDTGDWRFECQTVNGSGDGVVWNAPTGVWVDGVFATFVAIPEDMDFELFCRAKRSDGRWMYFDPAVIEDHEHDLTHAQPLYLTEKRVTIEEAGSIPGKPLPKGLVNIQPVQIDAWIWGWDVPVHDSIYDVASGRTVYYVLLPQGWIVSDLNFPMHHTIAFPIVVNVR